jgi:hypothetical protein
MWGIEEYAGRDSNGRGLEKRDNMGVNVYAEEIMNRIVILSKEIEGATLTGVRVYLSMPDSIDGDRFQGPFTHHGRDDDSSSAVTFWGTRDLRPVLRQLLAMLDNHYERTRLHDD